MEGTAVRQQCTQGVVVRGNAGRKVVFFQRNLKGVGGGGGECKAEIHRVTTIGLQGMCAKLGQLPLM